MKIIFLLNSVYPYYTGGRETWIFNVCNRLCTEYDISIISEKNYKHNYEYGYFSGIKSEVKLYSIKNLKNTPLRPLIKSYLNLINQIFSIYKMKRQLVKIFNSGTNCTIVSMDTVFTAKIGCWAKKYYKCRYISSVRGPHAEIIGTYYPLFKKYFLNTEKRNLKAADRIWANGWDTKSLLKEKGFNSIVIKNGLDITRAQGASYDLFNEIPFLSDYKIIMIGTLIDIKGYIELIQALSIVHKRYGLKVYLVALGKGNPKKYVKLAESLSVEKYVKFLGEKRETIEYAKEFDLAACLSGGSGLSMACLESMASRTPVIAWDTPVYRQMITHKSSGYLVEEKNIDALAEGIQWMLTHKSASTAMGEQAYNVAAQFDWSIVVESMNREFEDIEGV